MRADGDPRVDAARQRQDAEVARRVEASVATHEEEARRVEARRARESRSAAEPSDQPGVPRDGDALPPWLEPFDPTEADPGGAAPLQRPGGHGG